MTVTPYKADDDSKKQQVRKMFNNIANRYDFLNHLLSAGIDILWRKKAISLLKPYSPKVILDIATGTGDFAIEACSLNPERIVGIDISEGMLAKGIEKIDKKNLGSKISLELGDSENLKFESGSFDAITAGFGVRNFENLEKGLSEMVRVLKTGGRVAILEFAKPHAFPVKQVYNFYFLKLLPFIGRVFSKDSSAYTYLPESVMAFPEGENFLKIMKSVGFTEVKEHRLMFGIASIYTGKK
jgi:demethylmenaquinone methyltransferase/2-methoxy-6-polyprenyl-1,4-benzoquinol methylase